VYKFKHLAKRKSPVETGLCTLKVTPMKNEFIWNIFFQFDDIFNTGLSMFSFFLCGPFAYFP